MKDVAVCGTTNVTNLARETFLGFLALEFREKGASEFCFDDG